MYTPLALKVLLEQQGAKLAEAVIFRTMPSNNLSRDMTAALTPSLVSVSIAL